MKYFATIYFKLPSDFLRYLLYILFKRECTVDNVVNTLTLDFILITKRATGSILKTNVAPPIPSLTSYSCRRTYQSRAHSYIFGNHVFLGLPLFHLLGTSSCLMMLDNSGLVSVDPKRNIDDKIPTSAMYNMDTSEINKIWSSLAVD